MWARRARRLELQRLFSGFPDGAAGLGLLLLRLALGGVLVFDGARAVAEGLPAWRVATDLLAILSGCALVAGVLTPASALVAMAVCLVHGLAPEAARPGLGGAALALLAAMALAVALVGPGGFSLDARLFGRREIVVPLAGRGRHGDEPAQR